MSRMGKSTDPKQVVVARGQGRGRWELQLTGMGFYQGVMKAP